MKTELNAWPELAFVLLFAAVLPLLATAAAPAAASATPATAIPAVVTDSPAYQAYFKDVPSIKLYAEDSLSLTRRILAVEGGYGMLFIVLDQNKQTSRWDVAFIYELRGGLTYGMTVFHRNNQFVAVWHVQIGSNDWKTVCLRVDDRSSEFSVKENPKKYASFFWDETIGDVLGIGTNAGPDIALDGANYRVVIGSLDGKNQVLVDKIERVRLSVPPLLKQYDATTYRLWVTKSEKVLPAGTTPTPMNIGPQMIHCITLRKAATGYQVVDDKFVARISSGSPNSTAIHGYLDVEDKGKTYKLSLKTYPMRDGADDDRVIGEFAY
jgi:hypothetical protein